MNEKICLITGATRGIGRATAEALAKQGATVIVHGRDPAAVDQTCHRITRASGHDRISGAIADLSSLEAVRKLADEVAHRHPRLDVLVNNAGLATRRRETTVDGYERQFAVNHLAPFLLTNPLLESLQRSAGARVVTVSSRAHRRGSLQFDDLQWESRRYDTMAVYGTSKLANILFTRELARRLQETNVTANALHPGVVATHIFNNLGLAGKLFGVLAKLWLLSPARGAETSIYLASSPEVAAVSGQYFDERKAVEPRESAKDASAAQRLWEVSAAMTGLEDLPPAIRKDSRRD